MTSSVRRAVTLGVGAVLLFGAPASAHPFIRGGEVPVDSLVTMTLAMAHGCDTEADGDGEPTSDVSLEVPDWLRVLDVPEEPGWKVELETAADGTLEVVTWTTDDPREAAPDFDLEVVVAGEVGEERNLRVFQACDDFVYRWIGTPDDPADDPAVRVTLAAADPGSPPPPAGEPDAGADPDAADVADSEAPDTVDPADTATSDDAGDSGDPGEAGEREDADTGEADTGADDDTAGDAAPELDDADDADDTGMPVWLVPGGIALLLAFGVGRLVGRRI